MIKYSVIVPVYNTYQYVKNIIAWFETEYKNRDLKDIELVIIDDGSIEKPDYVIEHSGIKVYKKENGGVSSARNMGILKASGKYILFLDSDDMYAAGIFNILDQQANHNADTILFSIQKNMGNKTKYICNKYAVLSGKESLENFFIKNVRLHICGLATKKDNLFSHNIVFDESIHFSEDILFTATLLANSNKCIFIEDFLYLHTVREGSAMNSYMNKKALSHLIAFEKIAKLGNQFCDEKIVNFFIATCYVNLINFLVTHKTQNTELFDGIISKQSFLKKKMKLNLTYYSLSILILRALMFVDNILNYRLLRSISIIKPRFKSEQK